MADQEPRLPFVTGSRAYGTPREDSDVDLVAFMSPSEIKGVFDLADKHDNIEEYEGGGLHYSLVFGRLNLLCITDPVQYDLWKRGTEELKAIRDKEGPVSRNFAVKFMDNLWAAAGEKRR